MNNTTKFLLGIAGATTVAVALKAWQRSSDSLQGQTAVITGGSSGLGYLLARDLARAGCRVVICARREADLAQAQRLLRSEGGTVLAIPCDVSDQGQVIRLINQATAAFGSIDILLNNAGIIQVAPLAHLTLRDFEQAMNTMFWGTLHPTLAVLPQMIKQRKGRIVNITSIGGKVAIPHLLPYACAKFAAMALSEGLNAELQGSGVQVTTIVPGLMRTGAHLNALFKGQQEKEFFWFALGAGAPLLSIDAERAAQQIIRAMQRSDTEAILSAPAQLLAAFHGLFPSLTSDLIGVVNRVFLPSAEGGSHITKTGHQVSDTLDPLRATLLNSLAMMGKQAAIRYQPNSV